MGSKATESREHRPFESRNKHGKWAKICNDMVDSPAWRALTRSQRYLYLEFKLRYTAKFSSGRLISDNSRDLSIPASEAKNIYADLRTFRQDIDRLIDCGFIDLIRGGWNTREVNIYGFSERWKKYGQPDYEVPADVKRSKRNISPKNKPKKLRKKDPITGRYIKGT